MQLQQDQLAIWEQHVKQCYPAEACALVKDGYVIPVANTHSDPLNHFRINAVDLVKHAGYQTVLHSHVCNVRTREDPRTPSYNDQISQITSNVVWGVSSTDGKHVSPLLLFGDDVPIAALEGRSYVHGVNDCWGLVRDYYRLKGHTLNNHARADEWWDNGEALITEQSLFEAGFSRIDTRSIQPGDLLTYKINSAITNHFAVYTAQNQILHQLCHRLSGFDSYSKWRKFFVGAYRLNNSIK